MLLYIMVKYLLILKFLLYFYKLGNDLELKEVFMELIFF